MRAHAAAVGAAAASDWSLAFSDSGRGSNEFLHKRRVKTCRNHFFLWIPSLPLFDVWTRTLSPPLTGASHSAAERAPVGGDEATQSST